MKSLEARCGLFSIFRKAALAGLVGIALVGCEKEDKEKECMPACKNPNICQDGECLEARWEDDSFRREEDAKSQDTYMPQEPEPAEEQCEVTYVCDSGVIFIKDSCKETLSLYKDCGAIGKTCEGKICIEKETPEEDCVPTYIKTCKGGTIEEKNSCTGKIEEEFCQHGCHGDSCCGPYFSHQCEGNDVIEYDNCGQLVGVKETCKQGYQCVEDSGDASCKQFKFFEIGNACASDDDCGPELYCKKWPGGYCTKYCSGDNPFYECGKNAVCHDALSTCLQLCDTLAECRDSYLCYPAVGGGFLGATGSTSCQPPCAKSVCGDNELLCDESTGECCDKSAANCSP